MSHIKFSSPFVRAFIHTEATVELTGNTILATAVIPERRVKVIIQNQHATAIVTIRLAETGTAGLQLKAGERLELDNYNGRVRAFSNTAATPVHIAYAVC